MLLIAFSRAPLSESYRRLTTTRDVYLLPAALLASALFWWKGTKASSVAEVEA